MLSEFAVRYLLERKSKRTFESATAAFHQALRTNDAEALFAHVADDVLLMPPGEDAVRDKSAMRDWYAGFLSQFRTSSLTLSDREVFIGGGWAVELGSYEWGLTPADGGSAVLDRGSAGRSGRPSPTDNGTSSERFGTVRGQRPRPQKRDELNLSKRSRMKLQSINPQRAKRIVRPK